LALASYMPRGTLGWIPSTSLVGHRTLGWEGLERDLVRILRVEN